MGFSNKTAIATGAASGMGLCFSEEWAKQGGNVLMCDINKETLDEKVAQVNALNGENIMIDGGRNAMLGEQ